MDTEFLHRHDQRTLAVKLGLILFAAIAPPAFAQQPPAPPVPTVTSEVQWNRDLLQSGRVEELGNRMKAANKSLVQSVDVSALSRIRASLPSLDQFGSSLKYGPVVSVSTRGPEVIALIREVPALKGPERNNVLVKLFNFSRQGIPEALNFSGFVYEYGLFGAQRNLALARSHYEAAASRRYQPALLNLANMAYFGRGQERDPARAREWIEQAVSIGPEASNRVCGLASFMEYRRGDRDAALRLGRSCYSALANIPNAAYDAQLPLVRRIKLLRDSISTGAPDGYRWLEELTQRAGPDQQQLYCKYQLINRLRSSTVPVDVKTLARTCYDNTTKEPGKLGREAAVKGITTFVADEMNALERLRRDDRFHHTLSVPYLPFAQVDVDLYEPILRGK